VSALVVAVASACVDQLPDQDLRIRTTTPSAKLSADLLWKEFQDNTAAARGVYFGKVVEITGVATEVGENVPGKRFVRFGQGDGKVGVRANLLDESAGAVLSAIPENRRLTLRCFCEGLDGDLVLKSCIAP